MKILEWLKKTGVVQSIYKHLRRQRSKNKEIDELLQSFPKVEIKVNLLIDGEIEDMHTTLDQLCYHIISRGYASEAEFNRLNDVYNVYHKLGGNGSGTKLYEQAARLPIKEKNDEC